MKLAESAQEYVVNVRRVVERDRHQGPIHELIAGAHGMSCPGGDDQTPITA
jgi:hypothetical protein